MSSPATYLALATVSAVFACGTSSDVTMDLSAPGDLGAAPGDMVTPSDSSPPADAFVTPPLEGSLYTLLGPHKLAVVLLDFQDATTPETIAEARTAIFTGPNSTNTFFARMSYDRFSFIGHNEPQGDVFEVTLPMNATPCDYEAWAAAAQTALAGDGFTAANYDFIFYVFAGSCSSRGRISANPPSAMIDNISLRATTHEGGHTLGWAHASGYACSASGSKVALSDTCALVEYGDAFDVMGGNGTPPVNQHKRGQFGWLVPSNTQTVSADGEYLVAPIEVKTNAVQSLRVPRIVGATDIEQLIYIETRESLANSVLLRLAPRYNVAGRSLLIDNSPATEPFADAQLAVNETFTDPLTGITITPIDVTAQGARVNIGTGQPLSCVRAAPSGNFNPPTKAAAPGTPLTFDFRVTNNDLDCPDSQFVGSYQLPAGWPQPEKKMFEAYLGSGQSMDLDVPVVAPPGTPPGTYPIQATLQDATRQITFSATFQVQ